MGILPPNYDFRKNFTKSQRANIARKIREYKHFLESPQDFVVKTVKPKTARDIKNSGVAFKVTKTNRVIIPKRKGAKITIKKNKIVYEAETYKEIVYVVTRGNILENLENLIDREKKLKPNQQITAKIGRGESFLRARYSSYEELYFYITEYFGEKLSESNREKTIMSMTLVTIKITRKN